MEKTNFQSKKAAISLRWYTPEEIEKALIAIKDAYKMGLIESADVERFLNDFYFRDSALRYWTIGFQTTKWYCKTNLGWVEFARPTEPLEARADLKLTSYFSEPPPPQYPETDIRSQTIQIPTLKETQKFCTNCRSPVTPNLKFCTECGKKLQS